jgi:hypothetical protein
MARKMRQLAAVALIAGSGTAGIAVVQQPMQARADIGHCYWTTPARAIAQGYDFQWWAGYRNVNGVLVSVEVCTRAVF